MLVLVVSAVPAESQEPPSRPPAIPAPSPGIATTTSLTGQYLVKLDDAVDPTAAVDRLTVEAGVRVTRVLESIGWVAVVDDAARVGLRASSTSERLLDARPDVEAVQPVGAYFIDAAARPAVGGVPVAPATVLGNDPFFWQLWGLFRTNAVEAWDVTSGATAGGHRVRVAVVDTGVDAAHEDLLGQVVVEPGADFIAFDDDPSDQNGHGTHVAGAIVASRDNALGVSGVAPAAEVLPARACDAAGVCPWDAVAAAVLWAADHGAEVINLSISGPGPRPPADQPDAIRDAIAYAIAHDVVVLAASGNDGVAPINGVEAIQYPAAFDGVVGVGAMNPGGARAAFSIVGPHVDLVAPGVSMLSTYPIAPGYTFLDGTSMATAVASGAAALVRAAHPEWSGAAVAEALQSSAEDLSAPGRDDATGAGVIDVYRAITGLEPDGDFVEIDVAHARPSDIAVALMHGDQLQVLFNNPSFRGGEPNIHLRYPVPESGLGAGTAAVPGDWTLGVADFVTGVTGSVETFAVTSAGVRHDTTEPPLPLDVPDVDPSGAAAFTLVTLTVPAANSSLAGLEVDGVELDPPFEPETAAYALAVPFATASLEITATLDDPDATLTIAGEPAESGVAHAVPIEVGAHDIEVRVTAADGVSETTYTLAVDRTAPSTDAALATFAVSGVTVAPHFAPDTLEYGATVLEAVDAIEVTYEAADPAATVVVAGLDGGAAGSVDVPLAPGVNDIELVVTAEDGVTQRAYRLTIKRLTASTDWTLAGLVLSEGTLAPPFDPLNLGPYAASVPNGTTSVEVVATVSSGAATLTLDGAPIESGAGIELPLAVGANNFALEVTASDGTSAGTYMLTITRAAGTLSPPPAGGGGGGGGGALFVPTPTPSPTPVAGPPPKPPLAIAGFQPLGVSLWIVSPGGSMPDLLAAVAAAGADTASCTFATLTDGSWFIYIAGALNDRVNAAWNGRYGDGLPDLLPLWSRCGG